MTKREMLQAIIDGKINDELKQYAAEELMKLDSKKAITDDLTKRIYNVLTSDLKTIGDIVVELNDPEASAAKVSARLNILFKDGRIAKDTVRSASEGGKKTRVLVAYKKED